MNELKTINELCREFKNTALTPYRIREIVKSGNVAVIRAGKKYLVNTDSFYNYIKGTANSVTIYNEVKQNALLDI